MITASVVVIVICRTQSSENNDEKSSKTHNMAVVALILGIVIKLCTPTADNNDNNDGVESGHVQSINQAQHHELNNNNQLYQL